ncbi:MAG: transposase [Candidatus Helarchaeota archaeon]
MKSYFPIFSLSDLAFELKNNPVMAETLGFAAWEKPPSVERFSHFLRSTPNEHLQVIRLFLVHQLVEEKVILGESLSMDSCAIEANVRENNLKTSFQTRFDKNHRPSGDPEARLGVKIHYLRPFQKKIAFFWGYRNHILTDATSELPIRESTFQADEDERKQAIALLKELTTFFNLPIKYVIGDANYDTEKT